MDFFQFASYAEGFIPIRENAAGGIENNMWIALLVGGLCFLIVYIFQAVGLYTIAKRAGYGNKWMAFVPFFNMYYVGVCSQKNRIYGMNAKNFALIPALLEVVLVVGYIIYYVAMFTVWNYIQWDTNTMESGIYGGTVTYYTPAGFSADMPASYNWLGWSFLHLEDYVLIWLGLAFIIVRMLLLMAFFRTYSARQYIIFSVVGALLPLSGILIYAVRNNTGMSYSDYLRRVREQNYRMYQQQYGNPYNQNPYNNGGYNNNGYNNGYGGYNGNGGTQGQGSAPDPFDEYGSSSSSGNGSSYGGAPSRGDPGTSSGGDRQDGSPFDEFK